MFSEVAEIARLGQFRQLLKTRVILILNFTRPHAITYTKCCAGPLWTLWCVIQILLFLATCCNFRLDPTAELSVNLIALNLISATPNT